ncbi:magnesium chelatase subunit I [Paraburkholderia sp. HC6.4b]|uniref:ATP-binding protein n=1 Tax=unclassified Paraburkholderia TaxID=2615204 RepID=UPI001608F1FF|nr:MULTISPECIES: ATP-binding protein [unclassified Paraburkholderia]MBB5413803.1 magnesium chelatase subunit I [Paraburkholderia sp. HC6.4b]MBB5456227.1 magnesium chelatase subunit I [Paraburkholderia sp. Kb1A]
MNGAMRGAGDAGSSACVSGTAARPVFPFAALIGQASLQQALVLAAIDPGLGGVLISGPRGTAKSTAARALAELLPEGELVNLPLGASEDRLIGTLDIESVLRDGSVRFSPGLLAKAHRGVLYVDEVNLLPDALVDALLDAAASGVNTVERDGVSHSHDASFVLIGTMNPEEGELRPQLIDRFGLMVELQNAFEPQVRQAIVKARFAFDLDPAGFRTVYAEQQASYVQRIRSARAALPLLSFDDAVHARVSALCIDAAVDGLRADLVMLRAARALAAFERAGAVTVRHVERVADPVLLHRRRQHDSQHANQRRPESAAPARDVAAGASGDTAASTTPSADSDWGYLPPEPAAALPVKGVIALDAKKR